MIHDGSGNLVGSLFSLKSKLLGCGVVGGVSMGGK